MVLAQKQKYRSMEQDRKPRNKSTHLWSINQLQRRQDYTMEKRIFFNEWFSENQTAACKKRRKKLEYYLTLYTKINSKQIKDLNITPDTTKLLKENTGRILSNINHSDILFNPSLRVMQIKTNEWDLTKLKSFCTAKQTTSKMKRQLTEWEKIFANNANYKGFLSKIYKQLTWLNI